MTTASTRANPQALHEALTTGDSSLLPIGFMETFRYHFSDDRGCHSHAMGMCRASNLEGDYALWCDALHRLRCEDCVLSSRHHKFSHEETERFMFGHKPKGKLKLRRFK